MTPHFIWAGVVLVMLGLGFVNARRKLVRQEELERQAAALVELRREVTALSERLKAVEARQSKEAIWSGDSFAKLEGRLRDLENVVKAIAAVPKAAPPVRRA